MNYSSHKQEKRYGVLATSKGRIQHCYGPNTVNQVIYAYVQNNRIHAGSNIHHWISCALISPLTSAHKSNLLFEW